MRVLIVHPSITIRRAVRSALAGAGYTDTLEASTGEQALAAQQQYRVDVIVLGSDLGAMRGTELTQRLRAYPEHRRTPVIMVSDRSGAQDVLSAIHCGVDNYVLLPYAVDRFIEKVDRAVQRATALSDTVTTAALGPSIHQEVFLY